MTKEKDLRWEKPKFEDFFEKNMISAIPDYIFSFLEALVVGLWLKIEYKKIKVVVVVYTLKTFFVRLFVCPSICLTSPEGSDAREVGVMTLFHQQLTCWPFVVVLRLE